MIQAQGMGEVIARGAAAWNYSLFTQIFGIVLTYRRDGREGTSGGTIVRVHEVRLLSILLIDLNGDLYNNNVIE